MEEFDENLSRFPVWGVLDPSRTDFKLPFETLGKFASLMLFSCAKDPKTGELVHKSDKDALGEWKGPKGVPSEELHDIPWSGLKPEPANSKPNCSELFDSFLSSEFFESLEDVLPSIKGWMYEVEDGKGSRLFEDEAAGELTLKTHFSALYMALSKTFWENEVVREWVVTLMKSSLTHKLCQQKETGQFGFVMSLCHLCSEEVVGWPIEGEPCVVGTDALQAHLDLHHNEQLNAPLCPSLNVTLINHCKNNVTCKSASNLPFYQFYKESCDKVAANRFLQAAFLAENFAQLFQTFNNLIGTQDFDSLLFYMDLNANDPNDAIDAKDRELLLSSRFPHCFLFFMKQAIGLIDISKDWEWEEPFDSVIEVSPLAGKRRKAEDDE